MGSYTDDTAEWDLFASRILDFEEDGLVTPMFGRLKPRRQEAVVRAILQEAVEVGPAALNIKHVAARAGVSVGSLYQYFGSREALLTFAVQLCVSYTIDMLETAGDELKQLPLREGLSAYLYGGIEWSQTQTAMLQFLARAAYHGDPALLDRVVAPIGRAMRELLYEMLAAAAERGEVSAGVDLDATARAVNAAMIAVGDSQLLPYLNTYLQVTDETVTSERVVDALVSMIVQGIGPT